MPVRGLWRSWHEMNVHKPPSCAWQSAGTRQLSLRPVGIGEGEAGNLLCTLQGIMQIHTGFISPSVLFQPCDWTGPSPPVSGNSLGRESDYPEPSSLEEARPCPWLQSPQLTPWHCPCNDLSQVPPGLAAAICQLLNLAADLFPQLI